MKRHSRAVKSTSKILSWILIALLAAGLFGCVIYFTRGLTRDFSTVYLEIDGKRYLSGDTVQVESKTETRFQVRYVLGSIAEQVGSEFSVRILSTDDKSMNFDYFVNGKSYSFVGALDLSSGCNLKQFDSYFTICLSTELSDILKAVYVNQSVECPDISLIGDKYLRVVVTVGDVTMIFPLQVADRVTDVTLSPDKVVF